MTKEEDLKEVKKRIMDYPSISKEKKDMLLEMIASGKEYDFNCGYATIDRPWQSYFHMNEFYKIKNDKTIFQDILFNNKDYLDNLAIQYFGSNISYKEMFKNIESAAKSLEEYGIKKGDFVTVCCAGIPELIYTVYALAKIGAIANLMAPYFDKDQMSMRISDCESKTLIVMDKFYPQISEAVKKSSIENVIVTPTLNSSLLRYIPAKKIETGNSVLWNRFIRDGKHRLPSQTFQYEENYPLCMVYSSGTTGASKAIVLSHDSFQYSVLSYNANTVDVIRGQKMYQIIPPWYSTGFNTSIHLPLHKGLSIFQDPRFQRDIFVKNIVKQKVDYAVAPTSMYEGFLDEKLIKGKKLTNFENPFEGGEPLPTEVKERIEANFKKMGVPSIIKIGYGQCECGAQATSQSQHIKHVEGSVGIPIPGVMISIFDDDFNELEYGKRGNILVNTPCGMIGYYNNPEATNKYFYYDKYGRKWSCTGDIGYMSSNGDLFIEGRKQDYTIVNGKVIYNFDIENAIRGEIDIKDCDCIGKENQEDGKDLGVHIVFGDDFKKKYDNPEILSQRLCELQRAIFEKYDDFDMVPMFFKIRSNFPYKPSGKRDIEALSMEKDGFIYIDKEWLKEKILKKRK